MCINEVGGTTKQLVRQLTAAALNCGVSGGTCDCEGSSITETYAACDAACIAGQTSALVGGNLVDCTSAIDCFNNGGIFDNATNTCKIGNCITLEGADVGDCGLDGVCPDGSSCVPVPGNCHDRDLPAEICDSSEKCAASSSRTCKEAKDSACTVVGPGETQCKVCVNGSKAGTPCTSSTECKGGGTCVAAGLQCSSPETCDQIVCP
jgi:hypothetical protein